MRSPQTLDLLLRLDRRSDIPLRAQVEQQLRRAIQDGVMQAGLQLPATRMLAAQVGLSRGVIVEAYQQLLSEGYLVSQRGSGTRVAGSSGGAAPASAAEPQVRSIALPRFDFRPGLPDPGRFPWTVWTAAMRRAVAAAGDEAFRYPDYRGVSTLRIALARYLARARGTVGAADQLTVCGGFTQGMDLICRVLKERGARSIALEDPAFERLWMSIRMHGLATHRIPVDRHGLQVQRLWQTDADAVVVTPAHQYPIGAVLSPARRKGLLQWAQARKALIIEDDYDAEFRYDGTPAGALQGESTDYTIYVGTASKTLSPALRLGWVLAPEHLAPAIAQMKRRVDRGASVIEQLTLANFIERGELDRHLRRMRTLYRRRRDVLVRSLRRHLPRQRVHGIAAGLHVMVDLPKSTDELQVVELARSSSIRLFAAHSFWSQRRPERAAIVLGYGAIDEDRIEAGIALLATVIHASSSRAA